MVMPAIVADYIEVVEAARTTRDLAGALDAMTRRMGFAHFALTQHVDVGPVAGDTIRLHNYPAGWVEWFDKNRLATTDPIHRASQRTSVGFRWRDVPRLIRLTAADERVLERARGFGLVEGVTIPANVPGETHGSCSFALSTAAALPRDALPLAQLAGAFGFEGARRLWRSTTIAEAEIPAITDRQRDCLLWVARGKTDWEVSRILGISQETVVQHIKHARERYGVQKRTTLLVRTLFDGTLSFDDILSR